MAFDLSSLLGQLGGGNSTSSLAAFGENALKGLGNAIGTGGGSLGSTLSSLWNGQAAQPKAQSSPWITATPEQYSGILQSAMSNAMPVYQSSGNPYSGEQNNSSSYWQGTYGIAPRNILQSSMNSVYGASNGALGNSVDAMNGLGATIGNAFAQANALSSQNANVNKQLDAQLQMQQNELAYRNQKNAGLSEALAAMLKGMGNQQGGAGTRGYGDTMSRQQLGLRASG